jgi:hypothetical protein
MGQVVQISGSLFVLAAFVAVQRRWLRPSSLIYLTLNAVGSGTLAIDALLGSQWGFLLLEGVWAIVSIGGLAALLLRRESPVPQ